MPQRFLRPGLTNSERFNGVSFRAQSLFVRLITLVDDFGRYDGRPAIIHGHAFPAWNEANPSDTVTLKETAALCCQLADAGLIDWYDVAGKKVVQIEQWTERARADSSKYPDKTESAGNCAQDDNIRQENPASLVPRSSPLHHRSSTTAICSGERGVSSDFLAFWSAYPKRIAKQKAEAAWRKAKTKPDIATILAAIEKQKQTDDWQKDGGQYIPFPATWLNQGRWDDAVKINGSHQENLDEWTRP